MKKKYSAIAAILYAVLFALQALDGFENFWLSIVSGLGSVVLFTQFFLANRRK